jgi:tetratricopeptide (TPR) repeat protein
MEDEAKKEQTGKQGQLETPLTKLTKQEEKAERLKKFWKKSLENRLDDIGSCAKLKCRIWRLYKLVDWLVHTDEDDDEDEESYFHSALDSLRALSESDQAADRGCCAAYSQLLSKLAKEHEMDLTTEQLQLLEELAIKVEDKEVDPCAFAWFTYYTGKDHIYNGRAQEATDCFNSCLAFSPQEPKFLFKLGQSLKLLTAPYLHLACVRKLPDCFEEKLARQKECFEKVFELTRSQKAAAMLAMTHSFHGEVLWHIHEGNQREKGYEEASLDHSFIQ